MKLIKYLLSFFIVSLEIIRCFKLDNMNCYSIDERMRSSIKKNSGFKEFIKIVKLKLKPSKTTGTICRSSQCRSLDEILFIAYCKIKQLRQRIKKSFFLMEFEQSFVANSAARFSFVFLNLNLNRGGMKASTLFKLCIPTNRLKNGYAVYTCPLSQCNENYDALKCVDEDYYPAFNNFTLTG